MGTAAVRSHAAERELAAVELNRSYYEGLYRARNPLGFLLHGRISYDQQSKTRINREALQPFLRERKRERVDVLDYGCGWGTLLLSLPRRAIHAHAYDISRAALRNLTTAARLAGRDIAPAALEASGALTACRYDVVVCSHVLEHVPSDAELLREIARALRPGGTLLVNVPINERWPDPKHVRRYDVGVLRERLAEAGFRVVSTSELDRTTSALLDLEQGRPDRRRAGRLALRALRAGLAVLPLSWLRSFERRFLYATPPHQLVAVAIREAESPDAT